MSLLMDALRKAEEAKRAAAQSEAASPTETASAPHSTASAMQELGLEPMAPPASQHTAPTTAQGTIDSDANAQSQAAVHNAFAAKKPPRGPEDKAFMLALAGVAGIAALGIGAYVWWQIQPRSALATVPAANTQPAALATPPATLPPAPDIAETQTLASAPVAPSAFSTLPDTDAVERSTAQPVATPAAIPVRITRSPARVNPLLEQGYTALQQGDLAQAQQAYERMLAGDTKNADALYGLAAIALQRQQPALAEDYYLRILESDPRDAYAHAGLAGLRGRAASSGIESRLKTLIADQPDVAPLHFALGNVYAQDQRWRDAQQAYFLAYQNDSSNPDIAFNLAVSLDQLHQNKLAAQYYTEALRLRGEQAGAFRREQAQARLRELQAAGVVQ